MEYSDFCDQVQEQKIVLEKGYLDTQLLGPIRIYEERKFIIGIYEERKFKFIIGIYEERKFKVLGAKEN